MVVGSYISRQNKEEQKDCCLGYPPEYCCAVCDQKGECEAYYGCEDCIATGYDSESDLKTLFGCCNKPISSEEFQEYIQKRKQPIHLRK